MRTKVAEVPEMIAEMATEGEDDHQERIEAAGAMNTKDEDMTGMLAMMIGEAEGTMVTKTEEDGGMTVVRTESGIGATTTDQDDTRENGLIVALPVLHHADETVAHRLPNAVAPL